MLSLRLQKGAHETNVRRLRNLDVCVGNAGFETYVLRIALTPTLRR